MRQSIRLGLTLLEVIFAMVVILVGMVAVATLIPLAGRQAEDSYQITQGLAAGESALAVFNSTKVVQPSLESPWCVVDDIANTEHSIASIRSLYDRIADTFPVPANSTEAAVAQNESIGIGFCIDPLFWGFQSRVRNDRLRFPLNRTRFPFVESNISPVTLQPGQPNAPRVPRLIRGSLTDPNAVFPGSWLRQPAAVNLATSFGGDLIQPETKNKALGPIRSIRFSGDPGNPLINSPSAPQQTSWLMTVTPADSTPIIPLNRAFETWDGVGNGPGTVVANRPVQLPNLFDVSLVVLAKRDVREVFSMIPGANANAVPTNLPTNERVVRVTGVSNDSLNSGTFFINITAHPNVDAKVKVGDWIMLSRFAKLEVLPRAANRNNATYVSRQIHRWYRIVGITGTEGVFPITLRLYGKPWNWTEGEISDLQARGLSLPIIPPRPPVFETHGVILKDVVAVYERQIELQ
jgi:hypothetical protein